MQEQILGDYRILKQLGQGSLGTLYLAEHRFLKKQYLLKVLPTELCQEKEFMHLFESEVAKIAQLDHPHIVKVHNISCHNGIYFLVTDCIVDSIGEMTNLAQYMLGRKERLREEELLGVVHQIADALDKAHALGSIAHGSLKLNNILVGKGNPGMEVWISDFGLAKILSPGKIISRTFKVVAETLGLLSEEGLEIKYSPLAIESEKCSKLNQSFLQSFAFLAPEQKHSEKVSRACDVYAFGVLVYYLITGKFPEGVFEMPSQCAPEYQQDWDHVVTQCLNQDPKKRPLQLTPLLGQSRIRGFGDIPSLHTRPILEEKEHIARLEPSIEPLKVVIAAATPQPQKISEREFTFAMAPSGEAAMHEAAANTASTHTLERPSHSVEASKVELTRFEIKEELSNPEEVYNQKLQSLLNRDPVVTQYQPEKKQSASIIPIQTEMVIIQGGMFMRGSNEGNRDEIPLHKIHLHSFALDIHPVTNEQFVRFLEYMGGEKDSNYNDLIRLKDSRINRSAGKLSIESGYSKHPIVGVTWYGAVGYAKWAGKRLPTEAEWEVAARGGLDNPLYPTGDLIEKSQANFFSSDTTPVLSYAPNGSGLYDMAGNVYEWCQDWYGYNYYETSALEPNNPKGPVQGVYRVLRGGCWKSLKDDLRTSHRNRNNPGALNSTYGFRCAADVQ